MDDYYALLGTERTAPKEDLEKLIRSQLRTWSKRSNHPDLSRRQEAERRVQQLSEARRTLLDDGRRAEYDRGLALVPAAREPATAKAAEIGWLDEAERHAMAGDYLSSAYAARQARDADPGNADTWKMLAWANAEIGNLRDALYEAGRAAEIEPDEASRHVDLGDVQARMNMVHEAMGSYRHALELDPEMEAAAVGIAWMLQEAGQHPEALRMLEDLLPRSRDPGWLGDQLALALMTAAEAVPRVQLPGFYAVTGLAEVTFMRQHLDRARQVTRDSGLLASADAIDRRLDWCTERHWRAPAWTSSGFVVPVGVLGLIAAGFISLAVLGSGDLGAILWVLLLWALFLGSMAVIVYSTGYVPGWKINRDAHYWEFRHPGPW